MLVLARKVGEAIQVGEDVTITVVRIDGGTVRIGVEAPQDMLILRKELEVFSEKESASTNAQ